MRDTLRDCRLTEQAAVDRLAQLDEPIAQGEQELTALRNRHTADERNAQLLVTALNKSLDELAFATGAVDRKARSADPDALKAAQNSIADLGLRIRETAQRAEEIQKQTDLLRQQISDASTTFRNLNDNQRLRQQQRDKADLVKKHSELAVEDAKKAHRRYDADYHNAVKELNEREGRVR